MLGDHKIHTVCILEILLSTMISFLVTELMDVEIMLLQIARQTQIFFRDSLSHLTWFCVKE